MSAPSDSTSSSFDVLILVGPTEELETLSATLSTFPAELPTVLIAPLPGSEAPLLAEQLRRQTSRPVQLAENGTLLQTGCLYLSSPRQDELSFNRLLASVAVSLGEHSLVVVVGGEAPDGVAGLRALQGTGGTVLVQALDKAAPIGLARALIEAGAADLVVEPQRLGPAITDLLRGQRLQAHLITERVRAEEFLRDSEERLRLITDAVPALISYVDAELRHRFANEQYGRWFGHVPADLQGQHLREVLGEAAFAFLLPQAHAALAGQRQSFEMEVPFQGGGTRHVQTEFVPDVRPDGSVAGFYSLVVDISGRTQADQALRRSEKKYRTLFETMGQGYTLSELVRDETGQATDILLLEANPAYERLMGMSAEAARGRRIYDLFPEVDRWWLENYDRIVSAGRPERLEYRYNDLGGWFEAWVYPQGQDRFIALFEEITERKQREAQQAFLLKLSDALRPLTGSVELERAAMRLLGEQLGVNRSFFAMIEPDGESWSIHHDYTDGVPSCAGRHLLSDFQRKRLAQWTAGQMSSVTDSDIDPTLTDADRVAYAAFDTRAVIGVPVVKGGRFVALLSVNQSEQRIWSEAELALTREVAERTWVAIERARAEEAVRFSETRFSAMANLVPDLLWASEPDGLTTWYNQRWLGYTGQTFEQATGWGWTDRVHPEDREASTRRYQEAVAAGVPLRQEHRLRRHDGEYRWFLVTAFPLKDERGQVINIYGAATDIHVLRTLNTTLEEQVKERTRHLADLNAELAARTRALETFSQLASTLTLETERYTLVRHVQSIMLNLLSPAHTGYFELEDGLWRMKSEVGDPGSEALREWLKAGIPSESPGPSTPYTSGRPEYLDSLPPGQDVPAELSRHIQATAALPVILNGTPIGVLAVGRFDAEPWQPIEKIVLETAVQALVLTLERAEAVKLLAEEREALTAFARFTERTVDIRDIQTLAQQAAEVLRTTLNVTSAVYFELREGVWKALWVSGSVHPAIEAQLYEGIPDSTASFAQPAARREPMFFEAWDAVTDGLPEGSVYRAVARYPLFPQDYPAGMLGMASTTVNTWTEREKAVFRAVGDSFRLILERVATIQQIEHQRQRLADLNAELGNLITRTAHNLEAPARQLGHLLGPDPVDGSAALWEHTYDPVALKDEVARLKGVAQDLRQLSTIEEQPLDREPLPLGELFAEVSTTPPGNQVTWSIQTLPIVRGNRALLEQALDVLMTFTLSKTRGAQYVTVSSRQIEGEVQVTVQDDGVGLNGAEAATLFDLAVRTDHTVPVLEGSGLIQVRRILARHGGWAWAESQLSSGKIVLAFPKDEAVNDLEALFRQDKPGMS